MRKLIEQLIKFGIVGVIATAIDWAIFYYLFNISQMNYLIAKIIAFSLSLIINYYLSMKFVFKSKINNRIQEFNLFLLLSGVSFILTIGFMWLSVDLLKISPNIANVLVAFIVMAISFILRKKVFE